ncbi:kinase-like domain-containing protein [Obelidium mucronatum]|nr:kinase-like domain-containing protein [Obelidium mucronatum]
MLGNSNSSSTSSTASKPLWERYEAVTKHGEGAFGAVFKARRLSDGGFVAVKSQAVAAAGDQAGIPPVFYRELMVLQETTETAEKTRFPFVIRDDTHVMLVMDLCLMSLHDALNSYGCLSVLMTKHILYQLTLAIAFINDHGFMHRDLKPQNIMISDWPPGGIMQIKLIDFGLARPEPYPLHPMSPVVQTVLYRAPEVIFQQEDYGKKCYSCMIDMWSIGCIFAELLLARPLFLVSNEFEIRKAILDTIGPPGPDDFPNPDDTILFECSFQSAKALDKRFQTFFAENPLGRDVMKGLLTYNPKKRMHPWVLLQHQWFCDIMHDYRVWSQQYSI